MVGGSSFRWSASKFDAVKSMKTFWNTAWVWLRLPRRVHSTGQKRPVRKGLKCHSLKKKWHENFPLSQCAGCWFILVVLVSLLSLCWMYICLVTFNDQDEVNWWVITSARAHTHTQPALNSGQKPEPFFSMTSIVTPCCPPLFYCQARLHAAESVGQLVHVAGHHFCRVN